MTHVALKRAALTHATLVVLLATVAACATTSPTSIVKYSDEAIAIADRECGKKIKDHRGDWQAQLTGNSWFVWQGKNAWMHVTIDARDGSTDGCVIVR